MWLVGMVIAALLLGTFRLTTRYEYGPRSRRLLGLALGASVAVGFLLADLWLFPDLSGGYLVLAAAGLTLPVFVVLALVVTELLRLRKQELFSREISALRAREMELEKTLEDVDRRVRNELRRREEAERAARTLARDLEVHRERVERWQREGGAARIRSIKVEEWERELRSLDPAGLRERRARLERELREVADPDRRAQLEVQMSLAVLAASGDADRPRSVMRDVEQAVSEAAKERREVEAELGRVRAELTLWQDRLREFLSKEIELD